MYCFFNWVFKFKTVIYLDWPHPEKSFFESKKHLFDIRSKKKCLWIKECCVYSKKFSLIQRNRFVYIKENAFESINLSSIQRNFFFDRISKKCFFDSKKLFSGRSNISAWIFTHWEKNFVSIKCIFFLIGFLNLRQ